MKANNNINLRHKLTVIGLAALSPSLMAGTLNIADNALEISTGVEPNVLLLNDDSGSMDYGVMTPDQIQGRIYLGGLDYLYTHPDTGASGNAPSINASIYVVPDPEFLAANGVSTPLADGAWRAWNHSYNGVYYNPDVVYKPWAGVDVNGNYYTDADPAAALYNPYRPSNGSLNLTTDASYDTDCGATECSNASFTAFTVTGFYPARYYTWTDNNPANSYVDSADSHTLVEIRSTTPNYSRKGTRTDCTGLPEPDPNTTTTCSYALEIQNFANWFSYYRKRDLAAKAALSLSLDTVNKVRVGNATINNNAGNRVQVASMNVKPDTGAKKTLFDNIFSNRPGSSTPLRESLEKAGNYFACDSDNIFGTSSSSPGGANCPVEASPAGTCQQNYTILMTDGFWNGSDPGVGNTDSGSGPYDGGSFGDHEENTLADVAMHYYETDLHGGLSDKVPTTSIDVFRYLGSTDPFDFMHQHMATYTIGFGVNGTLSADPTDPADTGFTWPVPTQDTSTTIDDLRHAAWNGRGQFLSAANPVELAESLNSIFDQISSGSGAASSVAFNTQNLESGSLVFRAFFDTVEDTGDVIAEQVSLSGQIGAQVWSASEQLDSKVGSTTDTREIITYKPSTTQGTPFQWASLDASQQAYLNLPQVNGGASPDPHGEARLNHLRGQSEWEPSTVGTGRLRERYDYDPGNGKGRLGDIVHSGPVFVGKPPFLGRDAAPYPDLFANLYSQFSIARKSRREALYVGANDGMLHSLDANTGQEIFAYVPNVLFPELPELTDPEYSHRFFVDGSPSINDIFFTPSRGTNAGTATWNTVLVGGLGAGGKGYYALNVTDPDDLDTEAEAVRNVLWEFTSADDVGGAVTNNDQNLGLTFSEPLLAMSNISDGSYQRWVAIFGNGYNSSGIDGDAELYIAFIDGGQDGSWTRGTDFIKINTGKGRAESIALGLGDIPNGISGIRGVDSDLNGTVDLVYAGDLQGNVYRFDLSGTTVSELSTATAQVLFTATYSDGTIQPITNTPVVVKHPTEDGFIVIVGTGSWMTVEDGTSKEIQSIYGLWDEFETSLPLDPGVGVSSSITAISGRSRLQEQVFTNISTTVNGFTVRTLTNNTFNWGRSGGTRKEGWYIDLDVPVAGGGLVEFPGERAIRNFLIRGNFVFVNTVIPKDSEACNTGPGGFELAFDPIFGGSGSEIIFDTNGDGIFDANDNVNFTDGDGNIVTGIRFDESTPTDSSFIGNRKVTQTSDKQIRSVGTNTDGGNKVGRHSWREIEL